MKFLHNFDKKQISYNSLLNSLHDSFIKNPKDSVSLLNYMRNKNMIPKYPDLMEFLELMMTSPKMFNWLLVNCYNTDYLVDIIYNFIVMASSNLVIIKNINEYIEIFKFHKNIFCGDKYDHMTYYKGLDDYSFSIINAIKKSYMDCSNTMKFIRLRKIIMTFLETYNFMIHVDQIKKLIYSSNDHNVKYYLTICFKDQITDDDKFDLFNDFKQFINENLNEKSNIGEIFIRYFKII
jgi:hypothetical protein